MKAFQRDVKTLLDVEKKMIYNLAFLNWCSPCAISKATVDAQVHLLCWWLSESDNCMGIVMLLVFFWRRDVSGRRSRRATLDTDVSVNVSFNDQVDARGQQPLTYQGKTVFASHVDVMNHPWRRTPISKTRRSRGPAVWRRATWQS